MTDAYIVQSLTGCSLEEAEEALYKSRNDVVTAVDSFIVKPIVSGEKFIPEKPKIDTGMTIEQEALCKKGRWLQDQVNAVYSVAHSKTRTPLDLPVLEDAASHSQPEVQQQTVVPTIE